MPTFLERTAIVDCLSSLERQDYPGPIRILVVDGGSTDGTREIVSRRAASDPRIELLDNPGRSAASALNIGLAACRTPVLVRVDAHAIYSPSYVARSVAVLQESGAADAGGPMRPVGTTRFGRAVAAITTSRLGIGWGSFHYASSRVFVDTVFLGAYWTETLRRLGGWDTTSLQWGAEDHELNLRLRDGGGKIVCDPTIESWYFPRETPRGLARQYRNYGLGKASTLAKHRRLPTLRPLAPAALVGAALAGLPMALATRRARFTLPVVAWAAVAGSGALWISRSRRVDANRTFVALSICHWAYGFGFIEGLIRIVSGRRFASSPKARR